MDDALKDWKIHFTGKSNEFAKDLFALGALTFFAALMTIIIIGEFLKGTWISGMVIIPFGALVLIVLWALQYYPYHPSTIQKKGDELSMTVVRGNMGIWDLVCVVALSDINNWSFSEEKMILRFKVTSENEKFKTMEVTEEKFFLNGISPDDLSVIMKWLEGNFKHEKWVDED